MQQGFGVDEVSGLFRRRGTVMAGIVVATVLVFVLLVGWLPNSYEAATTLLVEPQSISERLVEPGVPETEINNRLHLIQMQILSRGRLTEVIDDLNVYPELKDKLTRAEVIEYMRDHIRLVPVLPELANEARAQTGVRPADVTVNTFQLRFEHRSAAVAAEVANRLANSFIVEHLRDRTTVSGDTREFIQEELRRLSVEIARVEREIAEVKTQNAGTLPEDFEANQRASERLTDTLRDAQRERAMAASDEAFYKQQAIAGGGADDFFGGQVITPRRRIEMLELALAEYRSRGFTDKHPDIIATQDEIARLKAEIEASASSDDLSPAQQNARFEMQRAGLRGAAAEQEIERARAQLQIVEQRLARTPKVAEQLAALEREHEHLFDAYQEFSKKRLEAGVAADMESRQKGEKFRVLEPAVPPQEASSPNRPLLLALGLMLGIAFAAAYGLGAEALDDSFHSPRRLQDRIGLPVLATIPPVLLPADFAARRALILRRVALAGAATAAVLVMSAAGYWWQSTRSAAAGNAEAVAEAQAG